MIESNYNSGQSTFTAKLSRLFGRIGSWREIVQKCENPRCDHRRVLWPFGAVKSAGMFLQGHWYCSPDCFEIAVQEALVQLLAVPESSQKKSHRIPIGLLLLSRGTINDAQLKQALDLQRTRGNGRIGKFLQEIRAVSEQDITSGLAAQWGCPVYPLESGRPASSRRTRGHGATGGYPRSAQCASLLPLALL